jgi:hypothetical protein
MKYLFAATFLLMSGQVWSCSCFGTSSIRETIATHPNLVEVQAVSVSGNEATLRVTRVLKGTVSSNTIQVGHWMCYASLYPELMKPQHTYVLPLGEPAAGKDPLEVPRAGEAIATIDGAKKGEYEMPGCAESGFELVDDKLYTFEPTTGAQRRLQLYDEYSHFLRWRPVSEILAMTWLFFLTSLEIFAERMGPVVTLIVLGLGIALAVVFVRLAPEQRRRLKALIRTLPALWLLIGLWGGLFRYPDLSTDQPLHDLGWQCVPPMIGLVVFFCFAAIHIRRVPVARVFAVGYSLVNAYFAVMMCLLSVMAINGIAPSPWM